MSDYGAIDHDGKGRIENPLCTARGAAQEDLGREAGPALHRPMMDNGVEEVHGEASGFGGGGWACAPAPNR